jgi:hypothetical protein
VAALNDMIKPTIVRLQHKGGAFAAEYDWQRGIIRFVDRGGTVDYDLVQIAECKRKEQTEARAQPTP